MTTPELTPLESEEPLRVQLGVDTWLSCEPLHKDAWEARICDAGGSVRIAVAETRSRAWSRAVSWFADAMSTTDVHTRDLARLRASVAAGIDTAFKGTRR